MASGTHEGDGQVGPNKRCRGADHCTEEGDGEIHTKRSRVATDSVENHGIDGDVYEGSEETADDGNSGDNAGEDFMYDDDSDGEEEAEETKDDDADAVREKERSYIVLTEDDIRARQAEDTAKVADVLLIPPGSAALLLRHFKWRPGWVQEEWFSDDQRVRDAVGLPPLLEAGGGDGVPAAARNGERLVCGICFDSFTAGRMRSAGCAAHFYCRACWRGYVHAAVGDGAACLSLRCPDPACSTAVVRELVDEVASRSDKSRYAWLALRSYVEESGGRIRWCPAPGCTRAVEFLGGGDDNDVAASVSCGCGHGFCWSCGEEAHRPVSCDTVRAWLAKNVSDSENANWLLVHTKLCPKCRRPIQKNQGCNHMTCRAPCGHQFCWLCLDPPNNHKGCRAYKHQQAAGPGVGSLKETAESRRKRQSKASLDRYLYHYERWAANQKSLEKVRKDMMELEKKSRLRKTAATAGLSYLDLEFLTKAYEQIAEGRRVLRWTHAYGYYLDPEHDAAKRALFEDLQSQANSWLERLHACAELERKVVFGAKREAIVTEKLKDYMRKLVNLTRVTGTFLENLVKAFETDLSEVKSLKQSQD